VQYTLHVSDAAVPAILGRGGQVIKEIMDMTRASIKVSQKGDYVPGTQLRIITISGNQVSSFPFP
jgi:RNA-binding protein Nova